MTQDRETLKLYILCRKKNNAFERKETESQSSGVLVNCFRGEKNKPWFIALANFYGVNYLGLISSYQLWSQWVELGRDTHSLLSRAWVSQLQIPLEGCFSKSSSKDMLFFFLRLEEREKHRSIRAPTRDGKCNRVMCPNWELNLQTFIVWEDAPTESPGQGTTGRREEKEKSFLSKSAWQKSKKVVFVFIFPILVKRFCFNFKCTWSGVWERLYFKTCIRSSCTQRGQIISGF